MLYRYGPVLAMALAAFGSSCQTAPKSASKFEHQKTVLGIFSPGFKGKITNSMSGNGCRIAMVIPDGEKFRAVVDGVAGPRFDQIEGTEPGLNAFTFSTDGSRYAYTARNGGNACVVVDGQVGPQFNEIEDHRAIFSQNGASVAYVARNEGSAYVVVNGEEGPKFDTVLDFTFSADGKHYAYVVLTDNREVYRMVVDGKISPALTGIVTWLAFSPDGEHLGYLVDVKENAAKLFIDGVMQSELPNADVESFQFSTNGKHLAYVASKDNLGWLVKDGVPGPPFSIQFINFLFSPDGEHVAYVEKGNRLLVDGKKIAIMGGSDVEDSVAFSPDGRLAAYIATKEGPPDDDDTRYVVANGLSGPAFDEISELTLSPDGKRVAYEAGMWDDKNDKAKPRVHYAAVVDGRVQPKFSLVSNLKFSPDSKHFAYVAFDGNDSRVILDGVPGMKFSSTGSIVFSTDGKHLAYVARQDGRQFVLIDGIAGPKFESVLVGPVVCKDGRLEYLALEDDKGVSNLVRVDVPDFSPPSADGVMPSWTSKFAYEHWGE